MLLRVFSWHEVRNRPLRTSLTLLSGAIGVAAVVALAMASTTARETYRELYRSIGGRAAFEVVSGAGESFDAGVVGRLREVPGVEVACPIVECPSLLLAGGERVAVLALGLDPTLDASVHTLKFKDGRFPGSDGLAITDELARRLNIRLGDQVRLLTYRGFLRLKVSGLLDRTNADLAQKGEVVLVPLAAGQRLLPKAGNLTGVSIVLARDAEEGSVRRAVETMLPSGLTVRDPITRSQLAQQTLFLFELSLNLSGGLSLAVAFFITLNAFFMNVAERHKQLGILRVLGATQRQVKRTILLESLITGMASGVLGVPLGLVGGMLVLQAMELVLKTPLPLSGLPWVTMSVGVVLGVTTAVAAAQFPARRAARISPIETVTNVEMQVDGRGGRQLIAWGVALVALGTASVAASFGILAPAWSIPGSIVVLIGLIMLLPPLLPALSWIAGGFLVPWLGAEAELARSYLMRAPVRTGLTIAVLFVGITTSVSIGNSSINSMQAVRRYLDRTLVGDYFLRVMMPDMTTGLAPSLPKDTVARVEAIPGVTRVEPVRFIRSQIAELPVVVIARDFSPSGALPVELYRGDPARVSREVVDGGVLLGTVVAHRLGKQPGDSLELMGAHGPTTVRIAGLITEYTVGGMAIVMDRRVADRVFEVHGADLLIVRAEAPNREAVGTRLAEIAESDGLILQSHQRLHEELEAIIRGVETSLQALLAIGVIVTGIGIVNCLTMNILEQTREYGVLRAIGMTRRQLSRMILWKAWIIGAVSLGAGVPLGLFLSWVMIGLSYSLFGQPASYAIQAGPVLGFISLALAVVLLSAILPAQRALRIVPIDAIREE